MERQVITAVRLQADGRQHSFLLGRVNMAEAIWIAEPVQVPVLEVVDRLMHGDVITSLFQTPDGLTPGHNLRVVALPDGVENVEVVGVAGPGRRMVDLPHF